MTKAVIKKETLEETVLREYRHLRTVIADEKRKVTLLDTRMEQLREKRKYKIEVIAENEVRFAKLRKQAAKIVNDMLEEDGD